MGPWGLSTGATVDGAWFLQSHASESWDLKKTEGQIALLMPENEFLLSEL